MKQFLCFVFPLTMGELAICENGRVPDQQGKQWLSQVTLVSCTGSWLACTDTVSEVIASFS